VQPTNSRWNEEQKKTQMVISLCVAVTDLFLGKKDG
jgi:hypothetical protein